MSSQRPATDATRAEALRLAEEVGAAEAGRRLGLPGATIRSWRKRAGVAGPPAGVEPADWVARKQAGAASAWEVAQAALEKLRSLLAEGKTADLQRVAIAWAVALDKSAMLEAAVTAAEERELRLDRRAGEVIVAVLGVYFDAVGLPFSQSRPLLAELLRQAEDGGPITPSASTANAARAAVLEHVERKLREASQQPAVLLPLPEPPAELEAEEVSGEIVDDVPSIGLRRSANTEPEPSSRMVVRRSPRVDFSQRSY